MQVLALFPQKELIDSITFPLESKLKVSVSATQDQSEFLQQCKTNKFDVAIVDYNETTMKAITALAAAGTELPAFVVCMHGAPESSFKLEGVELLGIANYEKLVEELIYFVRIRKEPGKGTAGEDSDEENKFSRIATNLLIKVSPLEAGVFIRLSSKKFVKLFDKGDVFDAADLKRYYDEKNVNYMYLPNDDVDVFIGKLNEQLKNLLDAEEIDVKTANEVVEETVDTVAELIHQIGVTDEVQELVANNVALSMKTLGDFPELGNIIKGMMAKKEKYIPSHSMMLAHVSCALAVCLDWYSDSTFEKLTIAAFLHDMAIRDQELCAVKSLQDLEKNYKNKFNQKQISEYKNHTKKASQMVAQFKEMPADVDKLILQHHEHPFGTGFPDAVNSTYITPLSSLFIVSHDLVDYAFDHDGNIDMEDFLLTNEQKYSAGHFKKMLKALAKVAL